MSILFEKEYVVRERARLDQVTGLCKAQLHGLCASGRLRVLAPDEHYGRSVSVAERRPYLEPGARVGILSADLDPAVLPEQIPLSILYQDEHLLLIDKPAGLAMYPGPEHPAGTLANAVRALHVPLSSVEGALRPGLVHRLDLGTSGVIAVACSDGSHRALAEQFARHSVTRQYVALVCGEPEWQTHSVTSHLGQRRKGRKGQGSLDPDAVAGQRVARRASTDFVVALRRAGHAVVLAKPHTGRKHQIRVHLAEQGFPLVGDTLYGGVPARMAAFRLSLRRPALHALALGIVHPVTGQPIRAHAPIPRELLQTGYFDAELETKASAVL